MSRRINEVDGIVKNIAPPIERLGAAIIAPVGIPRDEPASVEAVVTGAQVEQVNVTVRTVNSKTTVYCSLFTRLMPPATPSAISEQW